MHRIRFKRISESRILAADQAGRKWEVMVIRAGLSHNKLWEDFEHGTEGYPYYYAPERLREAIPMFDGVPAYAFEYRPNYFDHVIEGSAADAVKFGPGLAKSKVGQYSNPRWGTDDEGNEGIVCTLTLVDDALAGRMREAWNAGLRDFVGYSIDGDGDYDIATVGGQKVATVTITEINSVDVVTDPAAGGKNIRLVAAKDKKNEDGRMKANLRAAIFRLLEARKAGDRAVRILEADDASASTVAVEELQKEADALQKAGKDKALALVKEAIAALQSGNGEAALATLQKLLELQQTPDPGRASDQKPNAKPDDKPAGSPGGEPPKPADKPKEPEGANGGSAGSPEQIQELEQEVENLKTELDQDKAMKEIEASNLPEASKEHLKESVRGRSLTSARIREAITAEQKYIERLGVGNVGGLQLTERGRSDAHLALEGFFYNQDLQDDKKRPVRRFRSIREAKVKAFGGDPEESAEVFLGSLCRPYHSGERRRLREAMTSTTFDQAFADVMHKVMLNDYNLPEGNEWRKIVEVGSVRDFRDHNFARIGYWGDLPDVDPDGGTYQELPNLTDEGVAVSIASKGGMASITRKMIVNDDMRVIRLIPFRLSRAAKGGIRRAVFGMFTANSGAGAVCAYDGKTLIHSSHGNGATSGGTALGQAAMNACRVAMMRQRAYGDDSSAPEYLGEANLPKWLLIPPELETMAISLCKAVNLVQTVTASSPVEHVSGQYLPPSPGINLHSQSGLDYIVIPEWVDADNWYSQADPRNVPGIIVAFLNGQEEPELEQEAMGTGSNFTARKVTYRVSHDRGIKAIDHRGTYGQVV